MAALIYASRADDSPYDVVLVTGDNPDAPGLAVAEAEGIAIERRPAPTQTTKIQWFDALIAMLDTHAVDYVALAGFMRILPAAFVDRWADRIVNIHPSLLPLYKGLDTHAQALAAGDSHGGCSVHLVTAALDDGPVIAQVPVAIMPGDSATTLAARVLVAEHQLYPRALATWIAHARSPDAVIGRIRALALARPDADEVISHGMPCFGISKGKKFAYVSNDHHGDGKLALLVKISGVEEQAMLIEGNPARYYRPAYFGDGWVGIRLDLGDTDWAHIDSWLQKSWRAVAPSRLTRLFDVADQF